MIKGIVRNIDELGRIVIPKEIRKSLRIKNYDSMDIYLKDGVICIAQCKLQCVFCGSTNEDKLIEKAGIHICNDCIDGLVREVCE
jgi:transcriptional pleiotropic regulator of transition state genes